MKSQLKENYKNHINTKQNLKKEFLEREKLRKILKKESLLCREESLKVCREFDALPDPIPGLD